MKKTFHSKFIYRNILKENLQYLPKHAIATGGISGKKGFVRVRFDADWYRSANAKLRYLFRET